MTRKKTTEQFKKEVQEKLGNDYVVLGKYRGNGIPKTIFLSMMYNLLKDDITHD